MYASKDFLTRDRVAMSRESPERVPNVPNSPSIQPRDLGQGHRAPQSSRPSFLGESKSEYDSDEDQVAQNSYEDDDIADWRHDEITDSEFDDEDEGPPGPFSADYNSSRRDEGRASLPYRPHSSNFPSLHPHDALAVSRLADPYQPPRPLPSSTHRIKPGNRRRTFNGRFPSPSRHLHSTNPRYRQTGQEYEAETYDEYPRRPDQDRPVKERQRRMPHSEWSLQNDDPYNIRQSEGIHDSDLVASNRRADLRTANPGLRPMVHRSRPPMSRNELDMIFSQSYHPRRRPAATNPFSDDHTPLPPDYAEQYAPKYRSHDMEVGSDLSSNENEEAWTVSKDIDFQEFSESSGFAKASCHTDLRSNAQADEDILNPLDWNRKLSVTERVIQANHFNRRLWPDNWRHSDFNTSPKGLVDVWSDFLEVNNLVTQFGLDAALPRIDNAIYRFKRQGTLNEVVSACKAWSVQESKDTTSTPLPPTSSLPNDSWDKTCEQFQRLLIVRDYLIAVCKDAEYLNDLHPTMDAITWFERAQVVDHRGERRIRSKVIELTAVRISHLAEILKSLNFILQALLWSWGKQSTVCIQSDQETAKKKKRDDLDPISKEFKLESTRQRIFASKHYDNGEKRIQTCLHNSDLPLASLLDEVEVFAAILSQALSYQCNVHISDSISTNVRYGRQEIDGLSFRPRRLQCMGELIQNRNVWVLEQHFNSQAKYSYVGPPFPEFHKYAQLADPSFVRTSIVDLARIWGPIWKASEPQGQSLCIWYRLPGGYIGSSETRQLEATAAADEAPCHFSTVLDGSFGKGPSANFLPTLPYLLIGHGLPSALVVRKSCQTTLETGLDGMALQSVRTLKPYKYRDSTAFHVAVGHAGTQASWTTQLKTNPGILMKKSLLDRWKLEPKFRNPRLLLLWYGVEVSICTRNARRCRLVDVIRSRSMIQYLSLTYHPEASSETYKTALFDALNDGNPNAFIELYDNHPEWQEELGAVVAHCLQVLEGSGVNRKGELGIFVFVDKFHDPEQLAILPKDDHTWISLLKDSFHSAAFAVISYDCLGYPKAPGQTCRHKIHGRQDLRSVLQTSYTSIRRSDMTELLKSMRVKQRLKMADSSWFKIKRHSPRGMILGTWQRWPLQRIYISRQSEERFRERGQDGENGITVFAVSKKTSKLVLLREDHGVAPVIIEPNPASEHFHSANTDMNQGLDKLTHRTRSPSSSDSSHIGVTNSGSQKEFQSSTKDDAEHSHGTSQISFVGATPEMSTTVEILRKNNRKSVVDKGTQTDQPIQDPETTTALSPFVSGDFPSSAPSNSNISHNSSRQNHGSEDDADRRNSRPRSNRHSHSLANHSESKNSHSHRKRRSHGERSSILDSFRR